MPQFTRLWLAVVLVCQWGAMIAAVAQPPASTQTGSNRNQPTPTENSQDQAATARLHCPTAADIARSAQQLCGGSSVADSLQAIGLVRAENSAERSDLGAVLQANGLHTALDLRLLAAGGPEVAELMGQLRDGGISIGDRSKVRLLLGEVAAPESEVGGATTRNPQPTEDKIPAMATTEAGVSRRHLQQNSEGMSTDTIAIVLSVLVGAAGYVVQAYTARRAERSLAEHAQEQHAHEVLQQRDHERMVAQIARTDRAVDDCCVPVTRALGTYSESRPRFVSACAIELEATQPEAFTELYVDGGYAMKNGLELMANGAVRWGSQIVMDPKEEKGQTWAAPTLWRSRTVGCSARALDVYISDTLTFAMKPFVRELPEAFFKLMSADLDGPFADDYRGYIRYEIKPILDRIADTVHAHYAAIEIPPLEWLIEKFPGHTNVDTPASIVSAAVAYSHAWTHVLADWDAGRLDVLHPPSHMMWASLYAFFVYSRERGEAKREC